MDPVAVFDEVNPWKRALRIAANNAVQAALEKANRPK